MSAECTKCGADLVYGKDGSFECPECVLEEKIARLRAFMGEIAFDCDSVAELPNVDRAEARTWKSMATRIRAKLEAEK